MGNKGTTNVKLGVDDKKLKKGLKDSTKNINKFGKTIKKIGGIIAGAFAIRAIARWGKAALGAYRLQREAELKLATIMRDRMGLGEDAFKSIVKQTSAYQKLGVIGDEVQLAGAQQLATFVKQKKSLENLIPAMNNLLAQQKGYNAQAGDAVNIANMMGRVLTGQVASLSRVGISFTDVQEKILKTGTELEITGTLAQVIADNVGNMNQELRKTDLGKIKSWDMILGDMKEKLGKAIVPYLAKISDWASENLPKIVNGFIDVINTLIEWRNKSVDTRKANSLMMTHMKDSLIELKGKWENVIITITSLGKIMSHALKKDFNKIGDEWDLLGQKIILNTLETTKESLLLWKDYDDKFKKLSEKWGKIKHVGGDGSVKGIGEPIKKDRGLAIPTPMAGTGIDLNLITSQLASVEGAYQNHAWALIKINKDVKDDRIQGLQDYLSLASSLAGSIGNLWESQKEKELSMVGDNAEKRAAIEKKYANKQKAIALSQAAVNTALAVTTALAQTGILSPFVIPGILAAGAVQMAAIAAQKFALGGAVSGPTMAMVGEAPNISRSNPEYIGTAAQLGKMGVGGSHLTVDDIIISGTQLRILLKETDRQHANSY